MLMHIIRHRLASAMLGLALIIGPIWYSVATFACGHEGLTDLASALDFLIPLGVVLLIYSVISRKWPKALRITLIVITAIILSAIIGFYLLFLPTASCSGF